MSPRKIDMHAKSRNKRRPPRGMYLNNDCLMTFVTNAQSSQGENILKKFETELVELKRQVCFLMLFHLSLCLFLMLAIMLCLFVKSIC